MYTGTFNILHFTAARLKGLALLLGIFVSCVLNAQSPSFTYSSPVCQNSGTMLPVTSAGYPAGGVYTASPSGLSYNAFTGRITPFLSTPGSYTVSYVGSTCSCTLTATVQINPVPQVSITNLTVCAGAESSVVVSASPSTGLTYTWLPSGVTTPTLLVSTSQLAQSFTLDVAGTNGCRNRAVKSGTVYMPSPVNISGPGSACAGATITLFASGANNYTWNTGQNTSAITVTVGSTSTFTVAGKDSRGCISTGSKNILITGVSDISVNSPTMCSGKKVLLKATSDEAGISYLWQPGNLVGDTVTVSPNSTTEYTLSASINGCTVKKTSLVTVIKTYTPSTGFYYNGPICVNSSDALPVLVKDFVKGGTFASDLPIDPVTGMLKFGPESAGTHVVTYTMAASGCTLAANTTAIIEVNPAISSDLPEYIRVKEGTSIQLNLGSAGPVIWSPAEWLSCSDCPDPVASPVVTTKFCAEGIINNCYLTECTLIEVVCDNRGDLTVPNAFTPNGDGNNDRFCLKGWSRCITSFSVRIFNRWGEEVFASADPSFCWEGLHKGQVLNSDVFAYVIRASFNDEEEIVKKGNITLIR